MRDWRRIAGGRLQAAANRVRKSPRVLADGDEGRRRPGGEFPRWTGAGFAFANGAWSRHADKYMTRSLDGRAMAKIQPVSLASPKKKLTLKEETELLLDLSRRHCQSVPTVIAAGTLAELLSDAERTALMEDAGVAMGPEDWMMVQEWIPSQATVREADLVMSVLEQAGLGVYCGDLKSTNLRFDARRGVCVMIDLDQAVEVALDSSESAETFWNLLTRQDLERFGHPYLGQVLLGYRDRDTRRIFTNGALNLSLTTPFDRQETTRARGGGYHEIQNSLVYSPGVRSLDSRKEILDRIDAQQYRTVLDIGANLGLASHYFARRGCEVTATDLDASAVLLGQMIANTLGLEVTFEVNRLGVDPLEGRWDLALLFSVLHHTPDVSASARAIRESCGAALLEVRLREAGKAPENGQWVRTSGWDFETLGDLSRYLQELFAPCQAPRYLGEVDKGRHMFLVDFADA